LEGARKGDFSLMTRGARARAGRSQGDQKPQ